MFEPAARLPSAHGSEPVVTPANRLFVRGPALRQRTDVTQNMSRKTKAAGNAPRLPRPCTAGTFMRLLRCLEPSPTTSVARSCCGAGEEGFEPSHAGIKIRCLNQLGDSPIKPVLPASTHLIVEHSNRRTQSSTRSASGCRSRPAATKPCVPAGRRDHTSRASRSPGKPQNTQLPEPVMRAGPKLPSHPSACRTSGTSALTTG